MNQSWTEHGGPLAHLSADEAAAQGVTVVVTLGSDGRKPHLGYAVTGEAASPDDRQQAAAAVGLAVERLVFMEQVHGAGIAVVGDDDAGAGLERRATTIAGADAMVTRSSQIALVGLSADCPLGVLWETASGLTAIAHAGWRGTARPRV